jgi:hypothetical protein
MPDTVCISDDTSFIFLEVLPPERLGDIEEFCGISSVFFMDKVFIFCLLDAPLINILKLIMRAHLHTCMNRL